MPTPAPWLLGILLALPPGARPLSVQVDCQLDACPAAGEIRQRLGRVLGYDPIVPTSDRRVVVHFSAVGDGVATDLRLYDGQGQAGARRFETAVADWEAVVSATVMNIALIVEPGRLDLLVPPEPTPRAQEPEPEPAEPAPPEPEPQPQPEPEPEPQSQSQPEPQTETVSSGPSSLALVLGGGASYGTTPGAAAQIAVGGLARFDRLSAEVGLRYTFASSAAFAGGEVVADVLAADLAGCYHPDAPDERLDFAGCATLLAGAQRATSAGLPGARSVTLPMTALGARGLIEWVVAPEALPGMRLRLGVDLRVPLSWTRLRVDGRLAWQSAPFAVDGLAAIVRSF